MFVDGENYNVSPDPLATPLLRDQVLQHFAPLGAALPEAIFLPLGSVPTKVMNWLVQQGRFTERQVLAGLPHPSPANGERIKYFVGRKDASRLSAKTNAASLDAARVRLIRAVSQLG